MRQGQDALIFVCILYNPAFLLSSYSYLLSPTVQYSCWHCTIQLLEQEQCQSGLILLAHYVQYAAISSLRDICVLCQLPPESQPFQRVPITTVADGGLVSYANFNSVSHFLSFAFLFKDYVRSQLVRHRHGNQNHKGSISKNIERLRFLLHKYGAFVIKRTSFVFFQHSI